MTEPTVPEQVYLDAIRAQGCVRVPQSGDDLDAYVDPVHATFRP